MLFATPAYAQTATGGTSETLMTLFPLILLFGLFYFMILRPQQKRMKQHKAMVEALKRGDKVITNSGILGKITKVTDDEVDLEIAKDVNIKILKAYVAEVRNKPTPAPANDTKTDKK